MSVLDPKICKEHTTFYDKRNGVWRQEFNLCEGESIPDAKNLEVYPIGPLHYDPWVYDFSVDAMGPYANHVKKNKKDIGEDKIDENVHAFASDEVDVLPNTRKEAKPYDKNGSGAKAHKTLIQKDRKDIAEPKMEENVYRFASDKVDVLPNLRRESGPYAPNGSGPDAHKKAFVQRKKHDIGEEKMDEEVHGFANDVVDVLPNTRKEGAPYDPNGSGPLAHKLSQRRKHDIGEEKMDEEVHGFANDVVDVLPNTRKEGAPYDPNGSGPLAHKLSQKEDIANTEVRPDVWQIVSKSVNPVPLWRSDVPPEKRDNGNFKYQG